MSEPKWLQIEAVLALHDETITRFGGSSGVRDLGLLESALARPGNAYAHANETALTSLAASSAFGRARNHPFVDGNKRAAFLAAAVFLEINGQVLTASEENVVTTFFALAASELDEPALAAWLAANSRAR